MIAGEDFSPQKARILLALALARGCGRDEIADIFSRC
jgi:L-asparaginase/Glu-tRNA(Gln) amidotransferase subunit D